MGEKKSKDLIFLFLGLSNIWHATYACMHARSVAQSCLTLCDPMDCSPPASYVYRSPMSKGLSRHEYWSGLPFPFPGDLPDPGIKSASPALAGRFFTTELPGKPNLSLQKVIFFFFVLNKGAMTTR